MVSEMFDRKEYMKRYYEKHKDKVKEYDREYHYKRYYNISLDEVEKMAEEQDFRCAICGEHTKLYVDHDHETGRVRGLLCHKCNTAIGLMNDDEGILQNAITYLMMSKK